MHELLQHIVRALVDHPREVSVTEVQGDKTTVFELRCHAEDIGKVIGKSGKTIGSVRTLLSAISSREQRRVVLELID